MTITPPTLQTDRLTLRPLGEKDLPYVTAFFASDRAHFVGGSVPADQAWRSLAAEIGHWSLRGYGRWGVEERATGTPVGLVGLWNPAGWPEPEIGWNLWAGQEGKGYATEAARAARRHAYDTLGWTTVISLVDPANHPSAAVARRLGATLEGTYDHVRFGHMQVWRHPGPDSVEAA